MTRRAAGTSPLCAQESQGSRARSDNSAIGGRSTILDYSRKEESELW
jgi:hypothetical protein